MADNWKTVQPSEIQDNVFKLIGTDWMLITAGGLDLWNTMTASWGGLGVLWNKNVSYCFIRPTRYTYSFVNENQYYSLSFFTEKYRSVLTYCGKYSGRDVNKAEKTGLVPVDLGETVAFQQARLVLVCKKLYWQDIMPAHFIDPAIDNNYPAKDYHRMFVGEIVKGFCI
ncbi:MAG: flavin reductase family protein [Spirochaetota bacterium]